MAGPLPIHSLPGDWRVCLPELVQPQLGTGAGLAVRLTARFWKRQGLRELRLW